MGTREKYAPGTFSWVELVTSDPEDAKRFYGELFGWEFDDQPAGDDQVYTMISRDGHWVAALHRQDQPPHWNSYVTVESADETAEQATEHGGTVLAEPFDVMDAGRMAIVQDPTGAIVFTWEPKGHIGAALVNAPGSLTWNDLMTTDVKQAADFYCAVFGWEVGEVEDAPGDRMVVRVGEQLNGGMAKLPEGAEDSPPHWLPYFAVEDAEQAAGRVTDGGGQVLFGPMDVPSGKIVLAADPQGAAFALFSGELDD